MGDKFEPYFNTGAFVLDENNVTTAAPFLNEDPYMYVIQGGTRIKPTQNTSLNLAGGLFNVENLRRWPKLTWTATTNSGLTSAATSTYRYDYDMIILGSELVFVNPFSFLSLPDVGADELAFFAEYVKNPRAVDHDAGYLMGARIGAKKVAGPGQWQASYNYRRLERDAVLDIFPDSDAYGGFTDVKAHEYILSYGLSKNITLDLDYYQSDRIKAASNKEKLFQADLNFKF